MDKQKFYEDPAFEGINPEDIRLDANGRPEFITIEAIDIYVANIQKEIKKALETQKKPILN